MEGSLKESNYGGLPPRSFRPAEGEFLSLSFPFFLLETMKSNEEKCMAGQYKRGDVLSVLAMCQYAMGG
jgi:hypothetical protein